MQQEKVGIIPIRSGLVLLTSNRIVPGEGANNTACWSYLCLQNWTKSRRFCTPVVLLFSSIPQPPSKLTREIAHCCTLETLQSSQVRFVSPHCCKICYFFCFTCTHHFVAPPPQEPPPHPSTFYPTLCSPSEAVPDPLTGIMLHPIPWCTSSPLAPSFGPSSLPLWLSLSLSLSVSLSVSLSFSLSDPLAQIQSEHCFIHRKMMFIGSASTAHQEMEP